MTNTFVIGDVHGHVDRLAELIDKADAIGADIVQLGDLGHYDDETHQRDLLVWQFAEKLGMTVLWGNHDYANIKPELHSFVGWQPAYAEVMEIMRRMKPKFAVERHGYLLTHAGLAPRFMGPPEMPREMLAEIINGCEGLPVIDDISYRRGGDAPQGGILWRDAREPLADIKQVFGHSRDFEVRRFGPNKQSWCIDVASKDNDSLCGLWLPDLKVVAIGPGAAVLETPWEDSE